MINTVAKIDSNILVLFFIFSYYPFLYLILRYIIHRVVIKTANSTFILFTPNAASIMNKIAFFES